jgi:hypothetical protein
MVVACLYSGGGGAPPHSTPDKGEEEDPCSPVPLLAAAPVSRPKMDAREMDRQAQGAGAQTAKLDHSDEGLMDDILNELQDL